MLRHTFLCYAFKYNKVKNVKIEYIKLIGKVIEIKLLDGKQIFKKNLENLPSKTSIRYFSLFLSFIIAVCILSKNFRVSK